MIEQDSIMSPREPYKISVKKNVPILRNEATLVSSEQMTITDNIFSNEKSYRVTVPRSAYLTHRLLKQKGCHKPRENESGRAGKHLQVLFNGSDYTDGKGANQDSRQLRSSLGNLPK